MEPNQNNIYEIEYKGHRIMVIARWKHRRDRMPIFSCNENDVNLPATEYLANWTYLVKEKIKHLDESGVTYKNVTLNFRGYGYNPADGDSGLSVYIEWDELESHEDLENEIAKAKKQIDDKIQEEHAKKNSVQKTIESHINFLEKLGYTVTKN